ncbi:hypothetical protein GOP47_0027658 [Adiantum capillus-veneris]|nr:hypothetical protein GOP47_0027658 [Adiantum capillus-veneris]
MTYRGRIHTLLPQQSCKPWKFKLQTFEGSSFSGPWSLQRAHHNLQGGCSGQPTQHKADATNTGQLAQVPAQGSESLTVELRAESELGPRVRSSTATVVAESAGAPKQSPGKVHGRVERMKSLLATPLSVFLHTSVSGQRVQSSQCGKLWYVHRFPARHCTSSALLAHRQPLPTNHLVEQEFSELNLKPLSEQAGKMRIRQHVNPLRAEHMVPVSPPNWDDVFLDPSLPLTVDIGSGSGRFIMMLARQNLNSCNYLGLEIRHQLVSRANRWATELELNNLHFVFANATVSFGLILSTYPGPLKLVTISCPDPHFKARHHKRRIVQMQLVDSIINALAPGGQVFLQSDVKEVAEDMRRQFNAKVGALLVDELQANPSLYDLDGWLLDNPVGIRSEREIHAIARGGQMYRHLYSKVS